MCFGFPFFFSCINSTSVTTSIGTKTGVKTLFNRPNLFGE